MNKKNILLLVFVAILLIIAFFSIKDVLTPYVSFKDAMSMGTYVQVIGKLDRTIKAEQNEQFFTFTIIDKDNTHMNVQYSEVKPQNFEHAQQIVALGTFNKKNNIFEADKLLLKCPSKYTKEKIK